MSVTEKIFTLRHRKFPTFGRLQFTTVNTVIYAVEELLAKAMFMFFRQLGGSAQFRKSDMSGATNPIKYAGCTVASGPADIVSYLCYRVERVDYAQI